MNRRGWQAGVTAHWDEMRPKLKGVHRIFLHLLCVSAQGYSRCLTSHILCTETSSIMHAASVDNSTWLLSHCHSALLLSDECEGYLYCVLHTCVHKVEATERECGKNGRETDLREWECDTEAVKWQLEHNNSRTCFPYIPASLMGDFFCFERVIYFMLVHTFDFLQ